MEQGGSTRENTHTLVKEIKKKTNSFLLPILLVLGTSAKDIEKIAEDYWVRDIKHIVALRGDVRKEKLNNHKRFQYATDLIEFLMKNLILK